MPGDFRVVQSNIRSFAAHDYAGLGERVALALRRAGENAENNIFVCGKLQSRIGRRQVQVQTGGIGAREGRKRRHYDGSIGATLNLYNCGFAAFRARSEERRVGKECWSRRVV